jgi:hypothetical protein
MQKSFETPAPIRLDVRVPSGLIQVDAAETATTEVRLDGPEELLERTLVELRGDELRIELRGRRGIFASLGHGGLHATVRCPADSTLVARVASADVEARGRLASAEVQTASGDVSIEETTGALSAESASGDLAVGRAGGELTLQAVSGDMRVREAATNVRATSVSGDVRLDSVASGRVRIESVSGDVEVGVRRGSRVHVEAATLSGSTRSELELGDEPGGEGEGALVELHVRAVSGDIAVVRAPAPQPQEA